MQFIVESLTGYSILVYMNLITNRIEEAIVSVMKQISTAAGRQDFNGLESLTKKASELRAMKDQLLAIENRFQYLINEPQTKSTDEKKVPSIRELVVEVTQGMINQNLLTLTDGVNQRIVRIGEKLNVELPSGERFETELLATGNKLQERGKIRKFYQDENVQADDSVVLSEITPGRWRLKKLIRFRRVA
jgi:hypothetical protein